MNVVGKVHCFFEQSGTFKNEFKKLGIDAEDYDIQDNFEQTDHILDLFKVIDNAWEGYPSVFDEIKGDDLIIAFYPCIYFSCVSQMNFRLNCVNYRKLNDYQKIEKILERNKYRNEFYERLLKFIGVCLKRNLRMIFENPYSEDTYLKNGFLKTPDVVDTNRMLRGDYLIKPTGYWFWNCKPTNGFTLQNDKVKKTIMELKPSKSAGLCSEERSMISPDYARNFICDFILGRVQDDIPVARNGLF